MEDECTATSQYSFSTGRSFTRDIITWLHLHLLLLIIITICSSYAMCPARCSCNDDELSATCSGAALQVVPIQLNPELVHINLTHNKINSIHFTLEIYAYVKTLDISFNKIRKLGSNNFASQRHLVFLDLSHNNIPDLEKDVFKGLKSLVSLNLSYNEIENVAPNAFHDLHQLTELHLSDNKIMSLEDDLFQHLANLHTLVLDNNQILDIPTSNFKYTLRLQTLSISSNLIEFIDRDSFSSLSLLKYLSVSVNVISDMHPNCFDGFSALEYLDLSSNNFSTVPTNQLSKLANLTQLDLSGNYFATIPPVAFRGLFKLQHLHLDDLSYLRRIDARAFVDNIKLENVSMDDNKALTTIPNRLFYRNPRLTRISVVNNGLSTVESAHFPLDQLRSLALGGNPFICNCSLVWLWKLGLEEKSKPNESDIILDVNKISCAGPEELSGRLLVEVVESEINCSMSWVVVAILSTASTCIVFAAIIAGFYFRRVKCSGEQREHPGENNLYQNGTSCAREDCDDKFDTPSVNEYRALSPWENTSKNNMSDSLYAHYGYSTNNRMYHSSKPHIVYV